MLVYNRQKNGNNFMVKMSWIEILSISASIATILGLIITIIKIRKKLNEFIRKYKKQIYYSIFAISIIINIVLFFIIFFVKELPPPDSNNEKLIIEINILRSKYDSIKVEYKSLADEYHRITENRNQLLDSLSILKIEKTKFINTKSKTSQILLKQLDSLISEGKRDTDFDKWKEKCELSLEFIDNFVNGNYKVQFSELIKFRKGKDVITPNGTSQTERGCDFLENLRNTLIDRRNQ